MQGYQTLEEAAQFLSMSVDELRHMAQKNLIRSFQDRGTLRFRDQDIQELARQRGVTSQPDEPIMQDPLTPRASQLASGPPSSKRSRKAVTDFSLDIGEDQLDIGGDLASLPGPKSSGKNLGAKSSPRNFTDFSLDITENEQVDLGLAPLSGSQKMSEGLSDVHLKDGDDFSLSAGSDSDVKLASSDSGSGKLSSASRRQPPPSGAAPPITPPAKVKSNLAGPGSTSKRRSKMGAPRKTAMSPGGIPLESDSDAKLVGAGSAEFGHGKDATDSEHPMYVPPGSDDGMLFTEEINLDEEIRRQEAALNPPSTRAPAGGSPASAFELSDQDKPVSPSQLGNYSLEEAAQHLAMSPDELRQMAQRSQIRSFMARGSMRFRVPDVQELARKRTESGQAHTPPRVSQMGLPPAASEGSGEFDFSLEISEDKLDIGIGGELAPPSGARGSSKKLGSRAKPPGDSDFSLEINEDQIDLGRDIAADPRSDRKPPPGSDSDVRLMADQDFSLGTDSDIKMVSQDASSARRRANALAPTPPQKVRSSPSAGPRSPGKSKSKLVGSPAPKKKSALSSSGKSLVATDSDSDVKIVGAGSGEGFMGKTLGLTDSDIRLEGHNSPGASDEAMLLTEEINLDEEIRKQEEAQKQNPTGSGKVRPKSNLSRSSGTMSASPYDLPADPASASPSHDSSDFDLMPAQPGPSGESDDFSLELPDDDGIGLGDPSSHELQGPTSGINLADPGDGGISLEFDEHTTGRSGSTPRPTFLGGGAVASDDSGSEFELSLDDSSGEMPASTASAHDSSDFEVGAAASDSSSETPSLESDSDSEFELSLDDSSGEMGAQAPAADSDFEVGAAASDSSSENPSLDPDADSEFELSLDDSSGEMSSQVQSQDSDFEVGAASESSSENPSLEPDADSEFELSMSGSDEEIGLEPEPSLDDSGSDSEFELTLDDSGSPSSIEEEVISDDDGESDKDIFETDFEVPGLDEESGSQEGALDDTDLESSDFDIEDESGSQVVALDDSQDYVDEDDEPQPSKARGKQKPSAKKQPQLQAKRHAPAVSQDDQFAEEEPYEDEFDQQGAFDELAAEGAPEPHAPPRVIVEEKIQYIRPAPWGALPSILLVPCLLVMVVIAMLAFENIQSPNPGFKPEGLATKTVKDVLKQVGLM